MAQPTAYTPATDFSDDEANAVGGRSTVRTAALDAELSALNTTLDQVLAVIALNQRDDGEIRDGRVKLHTLAADVRALLAVGGVAASNLRGDWVTATAYVVLDVVTQGGNTYICASAHTSGTFATDLAADRWIVIAVGTGVNASSVVFAPTATLAATSVQAAIEETDTENRALTAAVRSELADVSTAGDGDAMVGWSAICDIRDGVLTRHASLAAAVTAVGSTRCAIVVRDDVALTTNVTIPATATLQIDNDAQITTTGFTLTINGRFRAGAGQRFAGTGTVAFGAAAQVQLRADWWPATAAGLQEALTAATGRAIKVSGAYSMGTTTVAVPAATWLHSRELAATWSGNCTGISFASGGGMFGGTLTGSGNASYDDTGRAIACFGTNNSPSAPTFVNGPVIRDVTITEWAGYGIFLGYTNGGSIEGCTITEIGYAGVAGVSCNDLLVNANRISTVTPGSSGGDAYGIFVDRNDQASETAYPRSYRVRITKNDVRAVSTNTGNNGQAIDTHAGVDFVIDGNNIEGCEVGIFVTASPSGTQAFAPKGVVVSNNTIRDTQRLGYGIQVSGAINGSTVAEYAEGIVVKGNTIFGHGIASDGTSGAIRVQVTRGLVLEGNTIRSPACNGIVFNTENIAFHAMGNTIIDPFDSSYASPACYFFDSNNNSGVLASGSLYYQNSGLGTNVATHSVRTDSGLTGLDIRMGPHILINVDSTHLTFDLDTTTGVNKTGFYEESGTTSLSAGSVAISFNKRFPSVPVASVVMGSDLNPVRVSAISETAMTVTGTGATSIYWRATT